MAKRSLEKSELSCSSGLPRIVDSQPDCSHKMISNGRRSTKKHIADNQRNADQLPRFDQECHKVQDEAESERVSFSTSTRRDKHLIRANDSNESHKTKQILVNGQRPTQTSPQLVDHIVKSQKKVRRTSQKTYQLSSCYSDNTASLIHPRKSDHVASEIKMRQVQLNAKAFVDQLFVERMLIRKQEVVCSDSKPFSTALQDLFVENLQKDKSSFTEKSPNKIVIMKPATSKNTRSENVTCHCSSMHPHRRSAERVPNAKLGSFSFRQVKRKLKHAFVGNGDEPNQFPVDQKEKLGKKQVKSSTVPDVSTVRIKSDLVSVKVPKKQEVNVTLEAKRHLSARFKNVKDVETLTCKRSPKTLRHILLSPEDGQYWCEMPKERQASLEVISSSNSEEHEGGQKITKMKSNKKLADTVDSVSENDTFTSEYQSPTCSINQLEAADRSKYRDEHQSPISVLEPFFAEDDNSPTSITSQSGKQALQTRRLDFEECSFESHPPISSNTCIDARDYISCYVHSVFQASCLDWDQLSKNNSRPEEFLHISLFDEVDFLPSSDCFFDYRLLFDHINEALLDLHQCYFSSTSKPALMKPEIRSKPLERLVLDEVLRESNFYLLPRTESRTLDQHVSKDVEGSRSWVKLLQETEELVYDVSDDILEEWILDVILELST